MSPKKLRPELEKGIPVFLTMIGDTFHFLRLEKGVSIRQVAQAIKMSSGTISDIEKGRDRGMRYLTFIRLCNYYDTTTIEFFSGSGFSYREMTEGQ